jgi:hypothetical protein
MYVFEDLLQEVARIRMKLARKRNSKHATASSIVTHYEQYIREWIETAFSLIMKCFPKQIHAVLRKDLN